MSESQRIALTDIVHIRQVGRLVDFPKPPVITLFLQQRFELGVPVKVIF